MDLAIAFTRNDASKLPADNRPGTIPATDGELLMRFVRHRDHHAFAQLVERHGGLVWLICRQALRHHQDVEDAFQATFLILAQRARTIRASDSAAAWLYKVALRTALAARRKRCRRREEQLAAEPPAGEEALPMIHDREMRYVLLDELGSLPERYQTPLVLRYLEGQSRRAIANETDSTLAQIQGRLVRGRRMLRSRLVRRGVSLSLAAGAITTVTHSASAAITPSLIAHTATSCLAFTTSSAASGTSSAALELAKEGVKAMGFASITKSTAVVTTLLLAGGIVWGAQQAGVGAGGADAELAAERIGLSTVPAATTVADVERPVAFVAERSNGTQEPERVDEQRREKLKQMVAELRDELAERTIDRADLVAQLELQELEKSLFQQQLGQLHQILLQLKMPQRTSSAEPESKDAQQAREKLLAQVLDELDALKQDFRKQIRRTAELSAALEGHERERTAVQRRLEDLERLLTHEQLQQIFKQFDVPQQPAPAGQATSTTTPSSQNSSLEPKDVIRINVLGVFADRPIDGPYPVEPMGTVALGPSYGRVKVAGLTILEAEEAIKRHLAELVEDPIVQVTMFEKSETNERTPGSLEAATQATAQLNRASLETEQFQRAVMQQLEPLQHELARLQAENAELKKQLEQNARQSP